MSEPRFSERLSALISRFRWNKKANVAITFAIASIPMIMAIGCVMDYALATRVKAKLQAAADAASVASLSQTSPGYLAAELMMTDGPIPAGVADALNVFNGNIANLTGYTNLTVTPTVTKTGNTITSNVQFSATISSMFLGVVGFPTLTMSNTSASSIKLPMFLDFYLLLDVSGSMGLGSTPGEMTRLSQINPDNYANYPSGCVFACHFATTDVCTNSGQKYPTSNYCLGYAISRTSQTAYASLLSRNGNKLPTYRSANPFGGPGTSSSFYGYNSSYPNDPTLPLSASCPTAGTDACIQLRADAVGNALQGLLADAVNPLYLKVPNEFRVGLYPFIQNLYSYFPLTSALSGSSTTPGTINYAAANLASLLDTNTSQSLGSGGTHFENAMPSINRLITSVGTGASAVNTLPYVFLITDGAQDSQYKGINGGSWGGSNQATVMDSNTEAMCTTIKNRGIKISILYIPYQPISPANASFAGNEDGAVNAIIPNISGALQTCASPNLFYTASTPADISAALDMMFKQQVTEAHITN